MQNVSKFFTGTSFETGIMVVLSEYFLCTLYHSGASTLLLIFYYSWDKILQNYLKKAKQ